MFIPAAYEGNTRERAARSLATYSRAIRATYREEVAGVRITEDQRKEVDAVRAERAETRRAVVPALEEILYEPIPVLDHGFVRVVDYMGDDAAIVQAARVSYGRGTKKSRDDAGLIRYLMRALAHHAVRDVRDQAAREAADLRRPPVDPPPHRQRQRVLGPLLDPRPRVLHARRPSTSPRSRRATARAAARRSRAPRPRASSSLLREDAERAYDHYEEMLNETRGRRVARLRAQQGLARELARMNLPLNFYTQWYWKIDLHNLFHFLPLRADAHAQYEIRAYADVMPTCSSAGCRSPTRRSSTTASAARICRRRRSRSSGGMLAGENVEQQGSGISAREWRELMQVLGR